MQKTFNFFYAFLLAILGFGATLMAEDITLTTYYPAPYGEYDELTVRGNISLKNSLANLGQVAVYNANTGNGENMLVFNDTGSARVAMGYSTYTGLNTGFIDLTSGIPLRIGYNTLSATPALFIGANNGNVGIGTTTPGGFLCYINGTGHLNAAAWDYASDARLKENINYIQSGLNVITQLQPVKFDYIQGEKRQAGFIAQEVETVLPDIITKGQDGMLGMKTESIIPYLVKAIQEQQKEIEALKAKLDTR